MAEIIDCESFLMLRAAAEQLRAAKSLRALAESAQAFRGSVEASCESAKATLDAAIDRTNAALLYAEDLRKLNQRMSSADFDLEAALQAREDLLALLAAQCDRCGGNSPFEVEPGEPDPA